MSHSLLRYSFIALIGVALGLTGCYEPIDGSSPAGGEDVNVSECILRCAVSSTSAIDRYPANIIVFNADGRCVSNVILTEAEPEVELSLERGNYHLTALASTDLYQIPSTFALQSFISMPATGYASCPLLMGQADVSLQSARAMANIQLRQQSASVTCSVTDLPKSVTSVNVSVSTPYTVVDLHGSFDKPQSVTIPCSCMSDGCWQSSLVHLFPGSGTNTVVSIQAETPDSTIIRGYSLPYPLTAAYDYQLTSSAGIGIDIDDIVVGDDTDSGSGPASGSGEGLDTLWVSTIPTSAPKIIDGHVLVLLDNISADGADACFLSSNEWDNVHSALSADYPEEAIDIANYYTEGGNNLGQLNGWTIPTKEEANQLKSFYAGADNVKRLNSLLIGKFYTPISLTDSKGENVRYLCNDAQHTFTFATEKSSITKAGTKATYNLRLVRKYRLAVRP